MKEKKVNTKKVKEETDNNKFKNKLKLICNRIRDNKWFNKRNVLICSIGLVLVIGILILSFSNRDLDTIVLETHANEVYKWKYEIEDKSIVKFYDMKRKGDIEGKTEKGLIQEFYTFKALKKGNTTIKFTFLNTKNGSYGEIKRYNVYVNSFLGITIKEK